MPSGPRRRSSLRAKPWARRDPPNLLNPSCTKSAKSRRLLWRAKNALLAIVLARTQEVTGGDHDDEPGEHEQLKDSRPDHRPAARSSRKMIINALNSGANVLHGRLRGLERPTWRNVVEGQVNLSDAVAAASSTRPATPQVIRAERADSGDADGPAARAGISREARRRDGASRCPARSFDFGLYFFHNARELLERGTGPYFYLPKMESHLEARLWNDVFVLAQDELGIPRGTIRATVLIETIPPRSRWTRSSTSCATTRPG